ncbi:MAG: aminoacyl-tRNA hydrolase [Puniceicoccales bacterium]|jgi:PTH1 family peptidyl-tRNA hydrolase|nr:aminoacyl-tRNA hydrolase [Puniceicoccales bacterium]
MANSLIIGLGNPGTEYDLTRHNVGFLVVDAFANEKGLRWTLNKKHKAHTTKFSKDDELVILAKPTTYMNESGTAVLKLCSYYKIPATRVIVIYDDIAFPVGDFKIHGREGTGGHNGVGDILSKIGGGFTRYRVGIGEKLHPQMDLKDHVLSKFSADEVQILKDTMPKILEYLQLLLDKGLEHTMNLANRKDFI